MDEKSNRRLVDCGITTLAAIESTPDVTLKEAVGKSHAHAIASLKAAAAAVPKNEMYISHFVGLPTVSCDAIA